MPKAKHRKNSSEILDIPYLEFLVCYFNSEKHFIQVKALGPGK